MKRKQVISPAEQIRWCSSCEKNRSVGEFYTSHGKPHGYCKSCARSKESERHWDKVADIFGMDEVERRVSIRRRKANAKPGFKVCARCLEEKPEGDFYKTSSGRESYCIPCRSAYDKKRFAKSPRNRLVSLINAARRRAISGGLDYDLTIEDLVTLWEDQEGRCWYTGIDLRYDGARSPEALSIDRVRSDQGYVLENVVLCCRRVNEMKREMTIEDLRRWCQLIVDGTSKKEVKRGYV